MNILNKLGKLFNNTLNAISNKFSIDIRKNKVRSDVLSFKLTNMFENTNVNVFIVESNVPNTFTMPGSKYYNHPEVFDKLRSIRIVGPTIADIAVSIENIANSSENLAANMKPSVGKDGKIRIGLEEVNCYITSSAVVLLEQKEITALLLYEIGNNISIGYRIMHNSGKIILATIPFIQLARLLKQCYNRLSNNKVTPLSTYIIVTICIAACGAFIAYLTMYFKNRQLSVADKFIEKVGYKEQYINAIQKIKRFFELLKRNTKNNTKEEIVMIEIVDKLGKIMFTGDIDNNIEKN